MELVKEIWSWIEKNRYVVILPVVGLLIWIGAVGCQPRTPSPLDPDHLVNARELEIVFKTWESQQLITAAKFEAAGQDLQEQAETMAAIYKTIITVASGGVADLPGLLSLLLIGGGGGAMIDNIRKRGVIAGLKKNA